MFSSFSSVQDHSWVFGLDFVGYYFLSSIIILYVGEVIGFRLFRATGIFATGIFKVQDHSYQSRRVCSVQSPMLVARVLHHKIGSNSVHGHASKQHPAAFVKCRNNVKALGISVEWPI